MRRTVRLLFAALFFAGSSALAQPPAEALAPLPAGQEEEGGAMQGQQSGGMSMQPMNEMATALTRMAEMCEQMMRMEMKMMPIKMAAGIFFGLLLTTALVLLVVLEVQWIRYWKRRLQAA